jgi:hypothetical protein
MKLPRLGARDRRALTLGAMVALPVFFYVFAVRPYGAALADARERAASQRDLLTREVALLSQSSRFPLSLRTGEKSLMDEAPRLFGGADALAASAALSNYVSSRALGAHVFLQGSDTRPPALAGEGVVALGIEVHAAGDLAGIVTFLQSLEDGPKLVRVERIALERATVVTNVAGSDEEVISLSATINGFSLAVPAGAGAEVKP